MTPVRTVHKKIPATAGRLNSVALAAITYLMANHRAMIAIRGIFKEEI